MIRKQRVYSVKDVSPVSRTSITKKFNNFYSKSSDSLEIYYRLWHGWASVEEARNAVAELGLDEEAFIYIALNGEWNAVSMETLGNQIVLNKDIVYYRKGTYNSWGGGFFGDEVFASLKSVKNNPSYELPNIQRPRISSGWTSGLEKDLETLFQVQTEYGSKAQPTSMDRVFLPTNSMILLGTTMFDTMVPVFKLNVMDEYLQNSPSRHKLWARGVSKYNYYTKEEEHVSKEEIARLRAKEESRH